jgi:hypothetical protein
VLAAPAAAPAPSAVGDLLLNARQALTLTVEIVGCALERFLSLLVAALLA